VITRVKGREVKDVPQLLAAVAALPPGEKAEVDVLRRAETLKIEVTPGRRNLARQAMNRR
jgi:serine protease DegQ